LKILLVNPPMVRRLVEPLPPLGIAYLAAALEERDIGVTLVDMDILNLSYEEYGSMVARENPDVVGITGMTQQFCNGKNVAQITKQELPDCFVMMGGPHVTFYAPETLQECREVDAVVRGEGEVTITEVIQYLEGERDASTIEGITYRDGNNILSTRDRAYLEDVDSLSLPARHLLPMEKYSERGSLITSRGCPGLCSFCSSFRLLGATFRGRSVERVIDELEYELMEKYHCTTFFFIDDTFTFYPKRTRLICEEILGRGLTVEWGCNTRVDKVSDELLQLMSKAGCTKVCFGLESIHPGTLSMLGKNITPLQVREAVTSAHNHNIDVNLAFMLGLPGETPQMIKETIDFVADINLGPRQEITPLNLYPGTTLYEKAEELGMKFTAKDWSDYDDPLFPVVETRECTRSDMIGIWTYIAKKLVASHSLLKKEE